MGYPLQIVQTTQCPAKQDLSGFRWSLSLYHTHTDTDRQTDSGMEPILPDNNDGSFHSQMQSNSNRITIHKNQTVFLSKIFPAIF